MLGLCSHINTAFPISCRENKVFSSLFLSLVTSSACNTNHTEQSDYLSSWCPGSFKTIFCFKFIGQTLMWDKIFAVPRWVFLTLPYSSRNISLILSKLFSQVSGVFCYFHFSFLKDKIHLQTYQQVCKHCISGLTNAINCVTHSVVRSDKKLKGKMISMSELLGYMHIKW